MKLTKEQLKEKAWFRASKVLFVVLFLIVQCVVLFVIVWDTKGLGQRVPMVKCDNGTEFQKDRGFNWSVTERFELSLKCDSTFQPINSDSKNWLPYDKNIYTLFGMIQRLIIPFIIICTLFWIISRAFYYIVIGELFFEQLKKSKNK